MTNLLAQIDEKKRPTKQTGLHSLRSGAAKSHQNTFAMISNFQFFNVLYFNRLITNLLTRSIFARFRSAKKILISNPIGWKWGFVESWKIGRLENWKIDEDADPIPDTKPKLSFRTG